MKDICTGFQHLGLPVVNMEDSVNFYKLIGFETIYETKNENSKVCFMKLGDMVIEMYESDKCALKTGAIDHIALNVKDIKKAYEWAVSNGLNTLDRSINYLPFFEKGVTFFTVIGPNSEKIEFNQIQ